MFRIWLLINWYHSDFEQLIVTILAGAGACPGRTGRGSVGVLA